MREACPWRRIVLRLRRMAMQLHGCVFSCMSIYRGATIALAVIRLEDFPNLPREEEINRHSRIGSADMETH